MKIQPEEFYSAMQVQKLIGAINRQVVIKHIKDNALRAIIIGAGDAGRRYAIKGAWVESFIERDKKGLVKRAKYTKVELKEMLDGAVAYCKLHGLTTLKELINHIRKIK